ncbi:hypothetical protein ATANTOWER_019015, partial [Ataeniobius toweri]|nr:hypothetical protein [Ataeniobius toweri]
MTFILERESLLHNKITLDKTGQSNRNISRLKDNCRFNPAQQSNELFQRILTMEVLQQEEYTKMGSALTKAKENLDSLKQ